MLVKGYNIQYSFFYVDDAEGLRHLFCRISIISHAVYVGTPSGADFAFW
jgi:hypothetical protein